MGNAVAADNGGQQLRDVFVSHSSKDGKLASQVVKILEQMGTTCWVAPRDILSGKQYNQAILDAIKDSSVFLLILSDDSNQSPHVEVEVERAFHYQKTIIPLRIKEVMPSKKLEYFISNAQWVDAFASPLHERLNHVAAVVKALQMHASMPAIPAEKPSFAGKVRKTLEAGQRNMVLVASIAMVFFGAATFFTVKYAPATGVTAGQMEAALSDVERQTSSDPRKELAKRGVGWHPFDFLNVAQAGQLEEVRLFRKGGMNKLVDQQPNSTCFGFILLMVGYGGPLDVKNDVWEEVLSAIGGRELDKCNGENLFALDTNLDFQANPEIKDAIRNSMQYYKEVYSNDFNLRNFTPLMLAVWMKDADLVKLFLKYGANPNKGVENMSITYRNKQNDGNLEAKNITISPLSEAKRLGLSEIVSLLSKHGGEDIRKGISG